MGKLVETLVPERLGTGFRWLLASSWTTNLGDGIALAAGPLLVASLTRDPFLVSLAALLRWRRRCCSACTRACCPTGSTAGGS